MYFIGRRLLILIFGALFSVATVSADDEDFDVRELTIKAAHQALRSGETSCEEIVSIYIERIEKYDRSSKLNSIIFINSKALKRAQALDDEFHKKKKLRSLHCVPVILKDNFNTADMPTAGGSNVLEYSIPPNDAFMVKKLREAGAIILAKSNMAEWAFSPYFTISSTKGETLNPYDLSRVPAGSSGGTAAAIAANFGLVGMGSDTGNSIRGPASHTALVGMRSTIGATSRSGIIPLVLNRDIGGPMTRTVEDNARIFEVIDGYDPADPITKASKGRLPQDYTRLLKKDALKGKRIGVLRELIDTETIDADIEMLMDKAIEDLEKAGAVIVDPVKIANFKKLANDTGFCSTFRYDINNYFASLGEKSPVKKLEHIVNTNRFHESSKGAMEWAMSVDVPPEKMNPPCVDVQNDPRRKNLLDAVVGAMDKHKIDALVYPSWNNPPRKTGDLKSPHGNNSPIIAPHTGQPAITVPMGFTSEGLPAGLQFLGRPFSEAMLYPYAYAYEQATRHRKPPKQYQ